MTASQNGHAVLAVFETVPVRESELCFERLHIERIPQEQPWVALFLRMHHPEHHFVSARLLGPQRR
jgi:hypothetical protein